MGAQVKLAKHNRDPDPDPALPLTLLTSLDAQVKLADTLDPAAEDPAAITVFLEQTVQRMIGKAARQGASQNPPMLPLIRLRVSSPSPLTCP